MSLLEFIKLNEGWNAEPNNPNPQIDIVRNNLVLSFHMNLYQYNGYKDGDIGFILLKDVLKYRLGNPNDEGFYRGQFRYNSSQVNWGEFYRIKNSDYVTDFPMDCETLDEQLITDDNLTHYIFFFRDSTFECIANDYVLFVDNNYNAYCPYCGGRLAYNGMNLIGLECKAEYSIKMTRSILVNIDLSNLTQQEDKKCSSLSKFYCPKCSSKLYNDISNGLVCLECGFHFTKGELYHLIEFNPHV